MLLFLAAVAMATPIRFEEVTAEAGLQQFHGVAFAVNHGAGIAWFDWDQDGWPDIVAGDPTGPTLLFRNRADGVGFEEATPASLAAVVNVTGMDQIRVAPSGIGDDVLFRPGLVLISDDATVSGRMVVLALRPDGEFDSIPVAAPAPAINLTTHGDIDGDGTHDIIATQYACGAGRAAFPTVFRLDRFPAGYRDPKGPGFPAGGCWPVPFFTDYDDNGRPIPFIATDYGSVDSTSYVLRAGAPEAMPPAYAMGVAVADVNGDQQMDYFTTSMTRDMYWLSQGDGWGIEIGGPDTEWGVDGARLKWGAAFLDADNDGAEELWVTAGPIGSPFNHPDQNARDIFLVGGVDRAAEVGVDTETTERTLALADWNRDGKMDGLVGGEAHTYLYRNTTETTGHYVAFTVPDEPGTRFRVTACGRVWLREWSGGVAAAAHEPYIHVGLGACTEPAQVEVRWPWRYEEKLGPFEVDKVHALDGPGDIVISPARATPGAILTVRSSIPGNVQVAGVPVLDGKATLVAPNSPGVHSFSVVRNGETLLLAPKVQVEVVVYDVVAEPWPLHIGVPSQLFVAPTPVAIAVTSGGAIENGVLVPSASPVVLDVDGQVVELNAVVRVSPASTILTERIGDTLRVIVAPIDGGGVAHAPLAGPVEAIGYNAAGVKTIRRLDAAGSPWRETEFALDTVTVELNFSAGVLQFAVPAAETGPVDAARSRIWPVQPYLRADGQDVVEIGVTLFDSEGRLIKPGTELLPEAQGLTLVDPEYYPMFEDLGRCTVYGVRMRAGTTPGTVTVRVGPVTGTVFVVPAAHVPVSPAFADLSHNGQLFQLIPRDEHGQRVGPGVRTDPPFSYEGFGLYQRGGQDAPMRVLLDDQVALDYADGKTVASVVVPPEPDCSRGGHGSTRAGVILVLALSLVLLARRRPQRPHRP